MTSLSAVLDTYSLEDILEMNDLTTEEVLEYLVRHKIITLPEVLPVEFDD